MKSKCALFDLDGTLFDTTNVNYYSYKKALNEEGFDIDYEYFRDYCNGRHFKTFIVPIVGDDEALLKRIHDRKKALYPSYLDEAGENEHLFMLAQSMKKDYDLAIVTTASKENVDQILDHFHRTDLFDLILTQEDVTKKKPYNVGLLMFSEHPEKYFPYARIEVVDIPDPTGTNMLEKIFTGPIQRQLKDALAFIRNYVIKEAVVKLDNQAEAIRIANYPFKAIEEILSNAVYHRSYQVYEPITVRITPECIEITSFPGFDRSISDESIAKGDIRSRIYRNRRIGDFLKELKLIEGRNTGFPNAMKALEKNGSGNLQFDMNPERDYLSITIPIHPYFSPMRTKVDEYAENIITILKQQPLTLTELAYTLGYKGITAKQKKTVDNLLSQKRLIYIITADNKKRLYAK